MPVRINFAHLRERSTAGGWIDFAVFDARSGSGNEADNARLLHQLTAKARLAGRKIDQSALAFEQAGRIQFYGSRNLVQYLVNSGVPAWTHSIEV